MVRGLALDWVGHRLYIAQVQSSNLIIQAWDDRAELDEVTSMAISTPSEVQITLSPYTG